MTDKAMRDETIGELHLRFDVSWEREETVELFCKTYPVRLAFVGDEIEAISERQRRAFVAFQSDRGAYLKRSEQELLEYYQAIFEELQEQLAESAATLAPPASSTADLSTVFKPTAIFFPRHGPEDGRIVGLLFDWTCDRTRGVAVKFVNEQIVEVGPDDIVI